MDRGPFGFEERGRCESTVEEAAIGAPHDDGCEIGEK